MKNGHGGGSVRQTMFLHIPVMHIKQCPSIPLGLVRSSRVPHIPDINGGQHGGRQNGYRTKDAKQAC